MRRSPSSSSPRRNPLPCCCPEFRRRPNPVAAPSRIVAASVPRRPIRDDMGMVGEFSSPLASGLISRSASADVGDQEALQFILRVKQTVERCLAQGMNKAQMFRVIREDGLHPALAFAVYKELRRQNRGFFQEYYCMIDLMEQRQRLNRLIHAYRTGGRNAEDGVRVPETVAPLVAMEDTDVPVDVEWPDQQAIQAWLSDSTGHQFAPAASPWQPVDLPAGEQVPNPVQPEVNSVAPGVAWSHQLVLDFLAWEQLHNHEQTLADGAFQGVKWPQQELHFPAAQQLHNHEGTAADGGFQGLVCPQLEVMLQNGQPLHDYQQPTANGGLLQGLTCPPQAVHLPATQLHYHEQAAASGLPPLTSSAAGLHNDAMMMNLWALSHGDQRLWEAELLNQQWPGASANPSPSSSLSALPENQN